MGLDDCSDSGFESCVLLSEGRIPVIGSFEAEVSMPLSLKQLRLSQEMERLHMIRCNKDRLIYFYINKHNLCLEELQLARMDKTIFHLCQRNYIMAYKEYPAFISFVLNVVNKCAIDIASRTHRI